MAQFEINLIRDEISPPGRRRLLFWCVLTHLLFCAAALSVVSAHAVQAYMSAAAAREEKSRLEAEFARQYPASDGIFSSGQRAEDRLQQAATRFEGINGVLEQRAGLARLMTTLLMPLPRDVMLDGVELNRAKGELLFDLLVTTGNNEDGVFASHVMQTWRTTPATAPRVAGIKALSTQRRAVDGKQLLLLKYSYQFNPAKEP